MPPHSEQIVSRICGALFRGSLAHRRATTRLFIPRSAAQAIHKLQSLSNARKIIFECSKDNPKIIA
ncbi:hypothetical protein EBA01_20170 [Xanthomonas oryzae pv. oryzae]|nr:hypothetical protein C0L89_20180 [Xanthomonas oryzae pv. oryzae]AVU04221.1 hypothetical protein C0L90_20245 [Xanthomonas oryzae pv. oryzae]QBI17426.1 hypothetical protein EYR03_20535 [Xanthomonas oryzae pv. oryzae]QBN23673.1 hypothetical protein EBA00_02375 [Xanthomonas oryzae pv. oryzae]QBN29859.1 hypothetical protein EBA01_20170 [Xanthomonas oryzae pv. oryzae]